MGLPVFKYKDKKVGTLYGRKLIKSGKQVVLMHSMDGFGMPKEVVDALCSDGTYSARAWSSKERKYVTSHSQFDTIEIHYEGTAYQASVQTFQEKGTVYEKPPYEAQYILPRRYFIAVDSAQLKLV